MKFLSILIVALLFSFKVQASDIANEQFSNFKNVERVYIYLDENLAPKDQELLPEEIRIDAIKKSLIDFYTIRFSSKRCNEFFSKKFWKPYGCNDQPIKMLDRTSGINPRSKSFDKYLNDPGTLVVALRINMIKNRKNLDPQIDTPLLVMSLVSYRPNQKDPIWAFNYPPIALPINQKPEILKSYLNGLLSNSTY